MKLKLSQLKQIIKEEVTDAMNEAPPHANWNTDSEWHREVEKQEADEWARQQAEEGDIKISDSLLQAESKLIAALKPLNAALEIDGFRASELYSKVDDAAATIAFVLEEIEKMKRP